MFLALPPNGYVLTADRGSSERRMAEASATRSLWTLRPRNDRARMWRHPAIDRMTGEEPDMNEAARTRRPQSRVAVPQWRGSSLHRRDRRSLE